MPAAVVAHRRADVLGHLVDLAEQVFEAPRRQLGMFVQRGVQIDDVRLVVLAVMDLHRLGIDVRLERRIIIRQRRQRMTLHGLLLGLCFQLLGHEGAPFAFIIGTPRREVEFPRACACFPPRVPYLDTAA